MTRTYKSRNKKESYPTFSPSELQMWEKDKNGQSDQSDIKLSDDQINTKYESGQSRVLMEFNREKLPLFVAALKNKDLCRALLRKNISLVPWTVGKNQIQDDLTTQNLGEIKSSHAIQLELPW